MAAWEEREDGGGKEGGDDGEKERWGGSALRLQPFNETVIYASPRNHKT